MGSCCFIGYAGHCYHSKFLKSGLCVPLTVVVTNRATDINGKNRNGEMVTAYDVENSYDLANGAFIPYKDGKPDGGTEKAAENADNWAWYASSECMLSPYVSLYSPSPLHHLSLLLRLVNHRYKDHLLMSWPSLRACDVRRLLEREMLAGSGEQGQSMAPYPSWG